MAILNLTLEIPEANIAAAKAGFFEVYHNSATIPDPNDPEKTIPAYTDKEWFEKKMQVWVNKICRRGWDRIRDREAIIVEDIFTE